MSQEEQEKILEDIFHECFKGLCDSQSISAADTCTVMDPETKVVLSEAALIGFGGPLFSGSISIGITEDVSNKISPTVKVCGELANQISGRIINRLCNYGLIASMGTPVEITGKEIIRHESSEEVSVSLLRTTHGGDIICWFDFSGKDGLVFEEQEVKSLNEGDIVLF